LSDEIECRNHDEGAPATVVDGEHGDVALSSPRGEHDDTASACATKRDERFRLKGSRLAVRYESRLELDVAPRPIVVFDSRPAEPQYGVGVRESWRSITARSFVPTEPGRRLRRPVTPTKLERSRDEVQ
jgi:hypothetical protein